MYPLGARGSISGPLGHSPVSLATSWWLSGGISAADVAGVWAAKGAASLAASYLRLAGDQGNANIDPAIVGGVAPLWDDTNGWGGSGASYLKTGIIPNSTAWSAICKITLPNLAYSAMPFGSRVSATSNTFYVMPQGVTGSYGMVRICNAGPSNDAFNTAFPGNHSIGFAGNIGYRNGAFLANLNQTVGVATLELYIMALNNNGSSAFWMLPTWYLSSIAFYKATITPPQVAAVHAAMP